MRPSSRLALALALLLGAEASIAADAPGPVADMLRGRLVEVKDGRLTPAQAPERNGYIAFYFGASWCGPCRAFVPELKGQYAQWRAAGTSVEIVFVSDDAGCRAMADYVIASRMPWPVVSCRHRDRLAWLQRARGAALPGLLVYDADGKQVITSWARSGHSRPRKALTDLERLAAGGSARADNRINSR